MRILIIGGTRFIGPYVVRELWKMGHTICLLHRGLQRSVICEHVRCIHGDRADILDYAQEMRACKPDVVLDMIPIQESDALDVMRVFRDFAGRVVVISSQDVYRAYGILIGIESGPLEPMPISEDAPPRDTLFPYRSQVTPEHRLYHYDKIPIEAAYMGDPTIPGTILRLPMVYGPGDYQHRTFPYLKRMDDGRPAIILAEGMMDWRCTRGYVEDIAHAIALAATDPRAAGRIYNIGEAAPLCEADWIRAIGHAAQWMGQIIPLPEDQLPPYLQAGINTAQHLVTDTSRIRAELDYTDSLSQEEALHRTITWERKNPPDEIDPAQFDYPVEDALLAD